MGWESSDVVKFDLWPLLQGQRWFTGFGELSFWWIQMDDNQGLMIIRDASHKHIQPLTLAYFRRDFIKIWYNIHLISTFMQFCFGL